MSVVFVSTVRYGRLTCAIPSRKGPPPWRRVALFAGPLSVAGRGGVGSGASA